MHENTRCAHVLMVLRFVELQPLVLNDYRAGKLLGMAAKGLVGTDILSGEMPDRGSDTSLCLSTKTRRQ